MNFGKFVLYFCCYFWIFYSSLKGEFDIFMLHVSLNITRVIDVGGVYALGELCLLGHKIITNPL